MMTIMIAMYLLDRKSPIPIRIHSKKLTRENRDYGMRREQAAYIAIMVVIIALQVFIFLPIWFGSGVILLWTKADSLRGVGCVVLCMDDESRV